MKILLVDDEQISIDAMLVGINWQDCGIEKVLYATNLTDAKEVFIACHPDLILLDIEMPGENGLEFLSWVRNVQKKKVPCAILTCHPQFDYAVEALHLDADDYVLKPVEYSKLEDLVCRMVKKLENSVFEQTLQEYGHHWIEEKAKDAENYQKKPLDGKEVVEETASYITSHLGDKLLVEDLAKRAHINPDYMNRLFKRYKDMPINKYIIKQRMELAGHLLREGTLSAAAVAAEVGYLNYTNFALMFKKYYGVSPGRFCEREEERENP